MVQRPLDQQRKRRASTNRIWTVLKAALNYSFKRGVLKDDRAWRRVDSFANVERARDRYLSATESARLINACPADLRQLVRAALETGCRFGELAGLTVADVNPDAGTVAVDGNTGQRRVILTRAGLKFFVSLTHGKAADDHLLIRANGEPWKKNDYVRPFNAACVAAKIGKLNIHALRHTWASLSIMAGMPLMVAARNLGHADTRMVERTYGHLAQGYVADTTREFAPVYDVAEEGSNVQAIR